MEVPWKVILAFVGVFIAGAVFGGVFTLGVSARRFANQPRQMPVERPLTQLPPVTQPKAQFAGPPQAPNQNQTVVRPGMITPQLIRRFEKRLNLTAEQQKKLRPIVGRAGEDLERMRQENISDVRRVTERMYADVSEILTVEQRTELEQMRKQEQDRVLADRQKRAEAANAEAASRGSINAAPPRPNPTKTPQP